MTVKEASVYYKRNIHITIYEFIHSGAVPVVIVDKFAYSLEIGEVSWFEAFRIVRMLVGHPLLRVYGPQHATIEGDQSSLA